MRDEGPAPEFSRGGRGYLALAHGLWGDLDGRNLASAVLRSRVHNRTSDRGGKPIRLAWRSALLLGSCMAESIHCHHEAASAGLGVCSQKHHDKLPPPPINHSLVTPPPPPPPL